ncbi:unnamed protein product [Phyllotreta striolata]|uniref:Structural maintenance of chromosomes protein n=1 Tax=Phyllotreta striolata TaxID=444603 RepID=A0A9N9XNT7_PHYSR|nr:unnamed protein product [Phyllotreta striolata]
MSKRRASIVILEGFKSYKERTVVDLDPNLNIIVGQNGSGKSSFLLAIQFIVAEKYFNMPPGLRKELMHNDSVETAEVLLIFDNSDNRFPMNKTEVTLKRVITSNTDNFFLNGKRTNKAEIKKLLNAVGIFSSNPFFIIEQGTINAVATFPPTLRYEIVRQLAGLEKSNNAQNFNDRIDKIKIKIVHAQRKYDCIRISYEEIKEESKAVKIVQNYDRRLVTINYVLTERQLEVDKKAIGKLTQQISELTEKKELYETELAGLEKNEKQFQKRVKVIDKLLPIKEMELNGLQKEHEVCLKEKTSLKMTIEELKQETRAKGEMDAKLAQLDSKCASKKKRLDQMQSRYVELRQKEESHSRELSKFEQQRDILLGKQGRSGQFDSKEHRDAWINEQIRILKTQISDKKELREKISRGLELDRRSVSKLKEKYDEGKTKLEEYKTSSSQCDKLLFELNGEVDKIRNDMNNFWYRKREKEEQLSMFKEQVSKAHQKLSGKIAKSIMNGIEGVHKVLEEFKSGGEDDITKHYYGLIIDIFHCDESLYTAVDVVSKTKLFYHVVESNQIATSILKKFNEMKLPGTPYFMPLNKLKVEEITYKKVGPNKPLLDCLNFNPKFRKVMLYMYNKILLCSDNDTASKTARTSRMNCVTFDGGYIQSNGVLSGGYLNQEKLFITLYKTYVSAKKEQTISEMDLKALDNDFQDRKRTSENIQHRIQQIANEKTQAERMVDEYKAKVGSVKEKLSNLEISIRTNEQLLVKYAEDIEDFETKQRAFERELQQDFLSQLSSQEQKEADDLLNNIQVLKKTVAKATTDRMMLEIEKDKAESELSKYTRLYPHLEKEKNQITLNEEKLAQKLIEKRNINEKINQIKEKIQSVELFIKDTVDGKRQESADREKLLEKLDYTKEQMEEITLQLAKVTKKEASVRDRIVDCETKLKNEVFFSRELHTEYSALTDALLFKEKDGLVKKIKNLDHCDKKCLRFLDFYYQREALYKKKLGEFNVCFEKCQELVAKQEHCTMGQLEFTLAQIRRYFEEIFRKIVPEGSGKVVFLRVHEDSEETNAIRGIDIKVSFNNIAPEMQSIQHLSGGQKTLIAYVFILALQKCDPAPFYVLDEIEQALESKYRSVMAKILRQVSTESQLIATTFNADLLEYSRKCFVVQYYNKLSNITEIAQQKAIQFVSRV